MSMLHKIGEFFSETFNLFTPAARFILKCGVITLTVMLSLAFILSAMAGGYTEYHSTIIIRDELVESIKRTFGMFLFSAVFVQWMKK